MKSNVQDTDIFREETYLMRPESPLRSFSHTECRYFDNPGPGPPWTVSKLRMGPLLSY